MSWFKPLGKKYLAGLPFFPPGQYGKFQFVGLTEEEFKAAITPLLEKNVLAIFLDTDQQKHVEEILGKALDTQKAPRYAGLRKIDFEDTIFICRVSHMLPGAEGYSWELAMMRRLPA
mgnify:CR=1 FL=1